MAFEGGINTGWANNCGTELFTLGWVQCPDTKGGQQPEITVKERRERTARERLEAEQQLIRTTKPLYEDAELNGLLPEDIAEITKDVVLGGKLYFGDTEVEFADIPKPAPLLLEEVQNIRDEVTQDIVKALWYSESQRYMAELKAYQAEIRAFEEEMMVFLLLLEDEI